ncbi:NADPH:quinone oxidoreductase family protein [Actinomadura sp. K4S16]|uniref:NADPH:quinone oxidoreductase family protein n=1 Tax=Actinomadura sp. K4S16 TaxID=1316147 RepID=UPI0011EBCD15|nr:NADPH:quinone oxidoreductase family protein [Actinomadura sp. K4S16]
MQAWRVRSLGRPDDVLSLEDVPEPSPGPGEVVIQTEAAALNFPDILVCRGEYQERPPLPFTPGMEAAGRVVSAGAGVTIAEGTRVAGICRLPHGGFAEQAVLGAGELFEIPDEIPTATAAAMVVTYQTGIVGLHRRAGLRAGETLLVHAGAGGIGSAAIQIGLAAGARVVATAGGAEKVGVCRALGADLAIDYQKDDFVAAVRDFTGGCGADVVYDPVGGETFDLSRRAVAFEGRIVVVGFTGGRITQAPTNHALVKNYSVVGLHLALYWTRQPLYIADVYQTLLRLYAEGSIDPLISERIDLTAIPKALNSMALRGTIGKIVVTKE